MQEQSRWPMLARLLAAAGMVAYPLVVWRGLATGNPRTIAIVMGALLLPAAILRLRSKSMPNSRGMLILPVVTFSCLAVGALLNKTGYILMVPVAINLVFLSSFASTLRAGSQPMIERFARLQDPDLTPDKQAWCRLWTIIWCVFFVLNGGTSGLLGWLAPLEWWTIYTGLIGYILSGILMGSEWILRRRRFAQGAL